MGLARSATTACSGAMRSTWWLLSVLVMAGCVPRYVPRGISVPNTPEAAICAQEAIETYERCLLNQRGRRFCAKEQDRALLRCPGAREGGPVTEEAPTYELPGAVR